MSWVFDLHRTNPTAQAIAILSLVCVVGMSLGSIQVRGVKLGSSGVLLAAILFGHFSEPIDHRTLEFVKEFGLILFVFCIGLQLGPGFFASLRESGLRLNGLAMIVVLLGAVTAAGLGWVLGLDHAAVLGVFSGATTNTPSLGAAQQTLASFPEVAADTTTLPALAYAVTYPIGIAGIIATLLALKVLFRIDVPREVDEYAAAQRDRVEPLQRRTLVVENPNLRGVSVGDVPGMIESGVVVSRIRHKDATNTSAATGGTVLAVGASILAIGSARGLDRFERVVGRSSQEDLMTPSGPLTGRRVLVTNGEVLGQAVGDLHFDSLYGVVVTRVTRGDIELTAVPTLRLQFGDVLQVVGSDDAIDRAAVRLGNSLQALNETQFVPLFAGISVGIVLGTLPIAVPGLPHPLRLGLAAGPLIVAILVGRVGHIGRLVWHMPANANRAFREFGIALFFASVGLMAGPTFLSAALSAAGLLWIVAGVCVTVGPLMTVGIVARKVLHTNYVVLAGLLAGSMTDPPALAFASGVCQSESPAVAYATVYPLTMLLRIVAVQALAVLFYGG
jgi:putative transport protein